MNHRQMNAGMTADFAGNVETLLGGTLLSAIDAAVRAELLAALGTLPAELAAKQADVLVRYDQAIAAVSARNRIKAEIDRVLSRVAMNLRAGYAPKEQFALCGFNYPFGPRSRVIPAAPADMSVSGTSNGVNKGRFTGNNSPGSVQYEIWRREGAGGGWMLLDITGKQSFTDSPVLPGQYYEYKARARSATAVSAFSGTATVYGRGM